jgi:hypothetical protein
VADPTVSQLSTLWSTYGWILTGIGGIASGLYLRGREAGKREAEATAATQAAQAAIDAKLAMMQRDIGSNTGDIQELRRMFTSSMEQVQRLTERVAELVGRIDADANRLTRRA